MDPSKIVMFVLDEADVMIDQQGQQDQTIRIQKWVIIVCAGLYYNSVARRQLPESCQKVLFSATYSDEVMSFAKRVVPDPIIIRLKRDEESLSNIKQVYLITLAT